MTMARIVASAIFLSAITSAPAWSQDMTFDIIYMNHTNIVVADGEITGDTPAKFQRFLDTEPFDGFSFYIDLNSPGGNLMGGIELGEMIRKEGLTARVASYDRRRDGETFYLPKERPGICMSACALAFLGGEDRETRDDSVLGFHQFSSAGNASGKVADVYEMQSTTQMISGILHDYIESMGVMPTLFSRMSMTLPEEMYIPTAQELTDLNIIPPDAFRNFALEPQGDGVIATAEFPGNVEGRNVISRVTAYCRGGTPYLLLSQPEGFPPLDREWIEAAYGDLNGFSLWTPPGSNSVDYPKSHVHLIAGGEALAEIRIDARGTDILLGESKGAVQLPGVYGRSMYFNIQPTDADKKALNSAFHLCVSPEAAAPQDDAQGQVSKDALRGYFNRYLADWSQPNPIAMSAMERAYGNQIKFYGGSKSKKALLQEKRAFAERWPERVYSARESTFETSCGDRICTVAAVIDWDARSSARGKTARGIAWYELGFDRSSGLIVYESGESRKQ